jgi:glycosyltransferase involved in cell wall biosynthesis
MKIGLNATCFNDRPSGAKQRFIGLYGELFKRMHDSEFLIYQPKDCDFSKWFQLPNIRIIPTPISSEGRVAKLLQGLNFWQSTLNREKLDLFECFNLPTIKNNHGSTIQTIHDIRSINADGNSIKNFFSDLVHQQAVNKCEKIITVSQTMKGSILNSFPNANVEYIYNGIDIKHFVSQDSSVLASIQKALSLPVNFLLAVGHFETRKNYEALIDCMALLKEQGLDYPLVIVGNDNGGKVKIAEKVQSKNLQDSVFLFSNLSDEEVQCIYQLCSAFIFPSIYEGFGIPILEAMAHVKPFILSDIDVFIEITENQGVYFQPHCPESMALAVKDVLTNIDISSRLTEYGQHRVKDFDFKNLALKLQTTYER